jgi:hypothetical protein
LFPATRMKLGNMRTAHRPFNYNICASPPLFSQIPEFGHQLGILVVLEEHLTKGRKTCWELVCILGCPVVRHLKFN